MIILNPGLNNFSLVISDKKVLSSNNFIFVFTHSLTGREVICLPTILVNTSKVTTFELTLSDVSNPAEAEVIMQAGYWEYEVYQSNNTNLDKTGTIILKGRTLVNGTSQIVENVAEPTIDGLSPIIPFCEQLEGCSSFTDLQDSVTLLQDLTDNLAEDITNIYTELDNKLDTSTFNDFLADPNVPHIDFNLNTTSPDAVGRLKWNDVDGTLEVGLKGGNVVLQLGQEQVVRGVNKTGANLLESQYRVIRLNGAQGNRVEFALAQANTSISSSETIGLVTENINNNQEGFVTTFGLVRNINTTGSLQGETWVDGDILYLSSSVAGGLTKVAPTYPNKVVVVGYIVRSHSQQGKIFVKVDVKTNKDDIGLGNVQNVEAVAKAGDTMTGLLTVPNLNINTLTPSSPLGLDANRNVISIPRSGTWVNRPTSPFIGQMFFATDLGNGTLFTWNGTSWRPSGNRIRIFSSISVAGAADNITETIVRTVNIPAGICEVGCVVRLIGLSTWSSTVATAKTIRVKASNNPAANVSLLASITNRSRAVISNAGFFGFNKPLIVRSTNQLWTGTINIETESAAVEGISPNFIDGINCTQSWTLWLTHQKPQILDVFDNQYFIVEIEYP